MNHGEQAMQRVPRYRQGDKCNTVLKCFSITNLTGTSLRSVFDSFLQDIPTSFWLFNQRSYNNDMVAIGGD